MPWKVCKPMDERLKFIARLLDGEKMAVACRDFGISRKTGYKILTRYNEIGLDGLTDRSRRPYRQASQRILLDKESATLAVSVLVVTRPARITALTGLLGASIQTTTTPDSPCRARISKLTARSCLYRRRLRNIG
jgi:Helix-turn-helix domain